MEFSTLKNLVGSPKFDTKIIVSNQSAKDIMNEILFADKLYTNQYKKIAPYFDAETNEDVAQNIFNFLKKNIKYVIESDKRQTSKSPAILFYTKKGDCKNYSNFAAGIFKELGIPYAYRFASYKILDGRPSHVYLTYEGSDGNTKIFDAVLNTLGAEAPYKHKIDKANNMALVRMSGVSSDVIGFNNAEVIGKGKIKKALKKAGQKIKNAAKKVKGKVVTYAATPVRAAFLGIIKINAFKSRDKLAAAIKKNPDKVKKFWNNFGGNFTILKKAAKVSGVYDEETIGVALATLAATAAPAVIAFRALLKDLGVGDLDGAENVGADISTVTDVAGDTTDADTGETTPAGSKGFARNPKGASNNASGGDNKMLLYGGLALLAVGAYAYSNRNN